MLKVISTLALFLALFACSGSASKIQLFSAVSDKDLAAVKSSLRRGAKVNEVNESGETPLMLAAGGVRQSRDIVLVLLDVGAEIDAVNLKGETALIIAVAAGNAAIVKLLVAAGADLNIQANDQSVDSGYTALMVATKKNARRLIDILLEAGADPNLKNASGETVLMIAVDASRVDVVKALVMAGADLDAKDVRGENALMKLAQSQSSYNDEIIKILIDARADLSGADLGGLAATEGMMSEAIATGKEDWVRQLIEGSVDINARDKPFSPPPLIRAMQEDQVDIALMLIEAGADLNARHQKKPPLIWALEYGYDGIVQALLKAGADVHARDGILDQTVLIWAVDYSNTEIVDAFLKAGAKVDVAAINRTALTLAAQRGYVEKVELLLRVGASVKGFSAAALSLAAKNGHGEIVDALLQAGAAVDTKGTKWTPLMWAANRGYTEIAKSLIRAGADVNITGRGTFLIKSDIVDFKPSALSLAALNGNLDVVELLLASGAPVERKQRSGEKGTVTPLMLASKSGYVDVMHALLAAAQTPML